MVVNSSPHEPLEAPAPSRPSDAGAATPIAALLAASHGFSVEASDGDVGDIETPLFPPAGGAPDFLVVRLAGGEADFAVVPVQLVTEVDPARRHVSLSASRRDVSAMRGDIALEY